MTILASRRKGKPFKPLRTVTTNQPRRLRPAREAPRPAALPRAVDRAGRQGLARAADPRRRSNREPFRAALRRAGREARASVRGARPGAWSSGCCRRCAADQDVGASATSPARRTTSRSRPGEQVDVGDRRSGGAMHNVHFDGPDGSARTGEHDVSGPPTYAARTQPYRYHCECTPFRDERHGLRQRQRAPCRRPSRRRAPAAAVADAAHRHRPRRRLGAGSRWQPAARAAGTASGHRRADDQRASARAAARRVGGRRLPPARARRVRDGARARDAAPGSRRVRSRFAARAAGERRVRLPGTRLRPGRYALTLRAGDIKRRVRFAVRPSWRRRVHN